jgi:BASS family bile acid:Na+ symporter
MLGMGLGLTFDDFQRIAAAPWQVLLGFVLQYTIMPCLAFIISKALALPLDLTIGLCLVGCSPGGTASNVITYLAKADVALSVAMTTVSTMGAVIMTPALTQLLLGTLVPVDALALVLSTVQVVLLPVVLGAALNQAFPKQVAGLTSLYSLTAVVLIALICGSAVATSASSILGAGFKMLSAVVLLHAGGFGLGYLFCKFLKCPPATCRTTSIEVGMQNSSLAMLMCVKHFSGFVLAPAVCAISACTHSVLGSMLAAYWRWMLDRDGGGSSSSISSSSSRGGRRPVVSWDAPLEERVADRRTWIAAYREDGIGAGGVVGSDAPLEERVADRKAWIAAWRRW